MESFKAFKLESEIAAVNKERQSVLEDNISRYIRSLDRALPQYSNLELARKRAGYIRFKAINGLEKYLIEFEFNIEKNGGKVIWAQDASEAVNEIALILKKSNIKEVIKSRSSITDEIDLIAEFKRLNIIFNQVTPGEFVLEQFEEKQKHSSSILIHKSFKEIAEVFYKKFNLPVKHNGVEIHNFIRRDARSKFETAKASIIGANFIIADTGSLCVTENTGDAAINCTLPRIQIILAGIDQVIPSISNLDLLLPLYASFSTGERINAYNTIISSQRIENEKDGPQELYVILIDNGRSTVLAQKQQRRVLSCIDCGACQNVCPVYRKISGENDTKYNGPAKAVTIPWMQGMEENIHLSYASTLCGKCTEICPIHINLHEQLIFNRRDSVNMKNYSTSEGLIMKGWHRFLKSRKQMDWGNAKWKNVLIKKIYSNKWGDGRKMPEISEKSFKELWEIRREGKK